VVLGNDTVSIAVGGFAAKSWMVTDIT